MNSVELRPMPTVEQLVQVFRERNWVPTRSTGARLNDVKQGHCCAIPVLALLADPHCLDNIDELYIEDDFDLYKPVYDQYGHEARYVYYGFDNLIRGVDSEQGLGALQLKWYRLGREFYMALTGEKADEQPVANADSGPIGSSIS